MRAIDEHVPAAAKVPAQERNSSERVLRDDPKLIRQRPEEHGDVVDALMVRDEHVGPAGREPLESFHRNMNPGGPEDQPRPRPRAPVREVASLLEEARPDRQRAEPDRVQSDGGRSEERRVGKECRSRWSAYHEKKKKTIRVRS